MEPKAFTADQLATLPPHRVVVFAEDQPQYRPLPTVLLAGNEGRVISRWALTDEERAAIANGEDLYIELLTFAGPLQPILPSVGLRDYCPADPEVGVKRES
jgi:hypothetical protein